MGVSLAHFAVFLPTYVLFAFMIRPTDKSITILASEIRFANGCASTIPLQMILKTSRTFEVTIAIMTVGPLLLHAIGLKTQFAGILAPMVLGMIEPF